MFYWIGLLHIDCGSLFSLVQALCANELGFEPSLFGSSIGLRRGKEGGHSRLQGQRKRKWTGVGFYVLHLAAWKILQAVQHR